ncbi:MAG: glycosyltransferase [Solirubrobacterales bacterium]
MLPCGPDLSRFEPLGREEARRRLGLDPGGRYLLFPANPGRPEKRHDRAAALAARCRAELLTGGAIDPDQMPLWMNAASAVLVTSEYEGFGMTAIEALACGVPVLSTPVGIAPYALAGIAGCLCAEFEAERWAPLAARHLDAADPRVEGAARAASLAAPRMAERVIAVYRALAAGRNRLGG